MSDLLNTGPDEPKDQEQLTRERRAQFAQANASLALEGMVVDAHDMMIQEAVATGEMTSDEAVALYVKKARMGAS